MISQCHPDHRIGNNLVDRLRQGFLSTEKGTRLGTVARRKVKNRRGLRNDTEISKVPVDASWTVLELNVDFGLDVCPIAEVTITIPVVTVVLSTRVVSSCLIVLVGKPSKKVWWNRTNSCHKGAAVDIILWLSQKDSLRIEVEFARVQNSVPMSQRKTIGFVFDQLGFDIPIIIEMTAGVRHRRKKYVQAEGRLKLVGPNWLNRLRNSQGAKDGQGDQDQKRVFL